MKNTGLFKHVKNMCFPPEKHMFLETHEKCMFQQTCEKHAFFMKNRHMLVFEHMKNTCFLCVFHV